MKVTLMLISFELCSMTIISNFFFWLNARDWKLVPGPSMILLKLKYSDLWPFLKLDIYHLTFLNVPYSPFQKKERQES